MPRLPDIRQQNSHECGVGLAQSVCVAFGVTCPHVRCSTRWGVQTEDMVAALDAAGLRPQMGAMDAQDLRYHLRRGRVMLVTIQAVDSPDPDDGHWVGVWRIAGGKVWIHDPDTGPRTEDAEKFIRKWKRWGEWSVAVGRE